MKSEFLTTKFEEIINLQDQLLSQLRRKSLGESIEIELEQLTLKIEKQYDAFKNHLLGEGNSYLTKLKFGTILPPHSYSYNSSAENIVCLESWRWIHRKLFHV